MFKLGWLVVCVIVHTVGVAGEVEVRFNVGITEIELAGTVNLPDKNMISGLVLLPVAGPTDRDLTLGPHKYFAELAEGLSAAGISSFRFDDRGTHQSSGDFFASTLQNRAEDACAARKKLAELTKLQIGQIGFLGLSEGSGLAILASKFCHNIPFRVLLSAPLRTGQVELQSQMQKLISLAPFSAEQKLDIEKQALLFLESVSADQPNDDEVLSMLKGPYGKLILPPYYFVPDSPEQRLEFVLSPWYQSQIHYDITAEVQKFAFVPTLGIYGGKDSVIDPVANQALMNHHMPDAQIITYPEINHFMQVAKTGSPVEYAHLPEGFSPMVLSSIVNWVLKRIKD